MAIARVRCVRRGLNDFFDEDYATGLKIQRTVKTGAKKVLHFGRNEGGAQYVHGWLDALLVTADEDLNELFRNGIDAGRITNY